MCFFQYGRAALEAVLKAVTGQSSPMIPPPQDYKGHFFQGVFRYTFVLLVCDGTYCGSVVLTDIRTALIGVGLVVKDDRSGLTILDKGKHFITKNLTLFRGFYSKLNQ